MKSKYLFIDCETGGLDPLKNALLQVACIAEIDGKEVGRYDFKMKPIPGKEIDKEALDVTGLLLKDIAKYEPSATVFKQFVKMLDSYINKYDSTDKFQVIAYNSPFDLSFIKEWFVDNNHDYLFSYGHYPWIDIPVLVSVLTEGQRDKIPNFKQGTIAKALGIEVVEDRLHDAMYDVELARDIFHIIKDEFIKL